MKKLRRKLLEMKSEKENLLPSTYVNALIQSNGVWAASATSASVVVQVVVGEQYRLEWVTTDVNIAGSLFRYGFTDDNIPSGSNQLVDFVRTDPQNLPSVVVVASKTFLIVQISNALVDSILQNKYLVIYKV